MSSADFFLKVNPLPADLRKELMDFLEFLLQRKKQLKESPRRGGVPGLAKGRIVIADDFDAPLVEQFC